ncbi:sulfatase-like hydrolase/transferase [Pontiellaceae bacterium B12227]|nr:sulfatase-like hydrolase/transferase [Pontiellaceae bacterium B12227]
MSKLILCLFAICGLLRSYAGTQPNIVLLYSDDAGYADFGFNGSRHFKTPRLDELVKSGVKLNQFYMTAAVCGPSRAGLLTGMYQQRFGFEENNVPGYMSSNGTVGDDMGLQLGVPTLGNHLQKLGYRTAIFGKWHQGHADRFHPLKRGFDEFVGFRGGARSFYPYPAGKDVKPENRLEWGFGDYREHEGYLTDVLADEACAFLERNKARPFFAYVSFNAVHTPIEADPQDAELFPALEGKRRRLAQMTFSMDRAIGRIVDQLEALGLSDNTLLVFTNDNGGPTDASTSSNWPLSGCKATHLEGGIRVPGIVVWPGRLAEGKEYNQPLSSLDLLPTFVNAAGGDALKIEGLDGVDMLPYLSGENPDRPHQTLYWKKESRGTIRDGDWKLMRFPDRPAELYNIEEDPSEQNNLAAQQPERVKALYKKLFAWECGLERPKFMLKRLYEEKAAKRFDAYRKQTP